MKKRTRRRDRLDAWLHADGTPVFLLDARRKVVFFNAGCERLTGWPARDVVGAVCDYRSEAEPDAVESITGSLCPPPEVLAGREASVPAYIAHRDGRSIPRLIHFYPLIDAEERVEGVLGVMAAIRQPRPPIQTTPARQLHAELAALRGSLRQRFGTASLVCRSEPMTRVLEQVRLACASRTAVFLHGEEGTGKEHAARIIHNEGETRTRAFVPLDCRRLPAPEIKQTLSRIFERDEAAGLAPMAGLQPGMLYLMHVESLPRDVQQDLVERLHPGDSQPGGVVRLAGSSTADLREALETDALRSDFYYLLTTIRIELPPLRRRRDDLQHLAQALLEDLNRGQEKQVGGFADEVWDQFRQYNWPGNVEELAAVIAEARAAATGELIRAADLPFRFRTGLDGQTVGPRIEPRLMPLEAFLAQAEAEQIRSALEHAGHNKRKAADLLGIPRPRLYRRMQALGIEDREGDG